MERSTGERRREAHAPLWRTRGYLPHFDGAGHAQHVVFRLADSLPAGLVGELAREPAAARLVRADAALDAGHGSRTLADGRIAALVQGALLHFDARRYELIGWCVMPSHVHVLVAAADRWPLQRVLHGWKSFTANRANRLLGRAGAFWSREYFDRAMRDAAQLETALAYIEANPVAAGLCADPADWPWSSARARFRDATPLFG